MQSTGSRRYIIFGNHLAQDPPGALAWAMWLIAGSSHPFTSTRLDSCYHCIILQPPLPMFSLWLPNPTGQLGRRTFLQSGAKGRPEQRAVHLLHLQQQGECLLSTWEGGLPESRDSRRDCESSPNVTEFAQLLGSLICSPTPELMAKKRRWSNPCLPPSYPPIHLPIFCYSKVTSPPPELLLGSPPLVLPFVTTDHTVF